MRALWAAVALMALAGCARDGWHGKGIYFLENGHAYESAAEAVEAREGNFNNGGDYVLCK